MIDDDRGLASRQPGVALHPAGCLCGGVVAAVVCDCALSVNVKARVLVYRYAGSGGGLDIDLRHAAGGLQKCGLLMKRGVGIYADVLSMGEHRHQKQQSKRFARLLAAAFAAAEGGFSYGDQHGTGFAEDHSIKTLVHVLSLERVVEVKTKNRGFTGKLGGFVQRRADKGVVIKRAAGLELAAKTQSASCQAVAD